MLKKIIVILLFILFIVISMLVTYTTSGMTRVITLYGSIMLLYLVVKMFLSFIYNPYTKTYKQANVCVLVPAYNEKPELLEKCIYSLLEQTYPLHEIFVVDDASDSSEAINRVETIKKDNHSKTKITIFKLTENKGKRNAQVLGIENSNADIYVTVDSDCQLEKDAIAELLKPFNDEKVMAVSGHVQALNKDVNLLTKLIDMRYENAFKVERAAQSVTGNILVCSGPLSAYRGEVLKKNLEHYRNQTFLGSPVIYGDDRCLTNYAIREGKTVYQSTAICHTDVPETLKKFLKQQLRWNKSFFRESIIAWKIGFKKPNVFFWVTMEMSLWIVFSLVLIMAILFRITQFSVILLAYDLIMASLIAYSRNVWYFLRHPLTFLLAPMYSLIHIVFLMPLRIYALCTLRDKKWGTR